MRSVWKSLRAPAEDRGAIGVIFAILLATGVIFSTVGIVVDLGRVYVHQKLVQKAADEVAQAMALHCQKTAINTSCLANTFDTKGIFGNNSQDLESYLSGIANAHGTEGITIDKICGYSNRNLSLPACDPLSSAQWDCKQDLTSAYDWVRVYTSSPVMSPILASFGKEDKGQFQEHACGQSFWGKAGSIRVDSTTSPLPFMIGMCEISVDANATRNLIVADLNESSCDVTDRTGLTYKSNGRGWRLFNTAATPATNAYCWTISLTNACTPLALSTKTSSSTVYLAFINLVKANLNKINAAPIFEKNNSGYYVRGFVGFKIVGFKFPTITGVSAATTTVTPSGYVWPATGNCSGTATSSSKFCIVGTYENKVSTPYGNNRAVTITNDISVPDFGYTIVKHGY